MNFEASAEVYQPAFAASDKVRRLVVADLNARMTSSVLAEAECTIRYVPVIMPLDMRPEYPARSRLRLKERAYDCSPQLDYDIFLVGSFADQLAEYLRGILECVPKLAKLGVTQAQMVELEAIVIGARDRIHNPTYN
jgi:hypothetical protein